MRLAALSITIFGVGRMGRLVGEIATQRGHSIVARLDSKSAGVAIPKSTDVAIDFSIASAVLPNVRRACAARCDLVVGTTGWDLSGEREELKLTVEAAGTGAVVAPNFSFGAHLFRLLVREAARLASGDAEVDLWIEEAHHRMKADHPSGTALSLARDVLERLPRKNEILTRLPEGPVPPGALVVSAARGGFEPGLHRLVLDAPEEQITLEHRARSRRAFAAGAVRAAEWVRGRRGTFTLDDVISTSNGAPS